MQHFTRNTVEASAWCPKCRKRSMHRVDADQMQGRLGPCLECIARLDAQHEAVIDIDELRRKLQPEQKELFAI